MTIHFDIKAVCLTIGQAQAELRSAGQPSAAVSTCEHLAMLFRTPLAVTATKSTRQPRGLQHKPGSCGVVVVCLLIALSAPLSAQANPSAFDDVVSRAAAARARNDMAAAIELYRQAMGLKPEWPDGWWFLGSLQYRTGANAAAREALTRYLALVPDSGPALAIRGLCEFELEEYSESLQDIQRGLSQGAADHSRNEEILRYHEALLLTRNGHFEDALHDYALLSRNGVSDPEMLMGIGLAGLRTPLLPSDVVAGLRELLTTAGKAAADFMSGDHTKAAAEFQNLFDRFPEAANAHYLYGYLLFATDPDQAVVEFKNELKITAANAAAQVMLAWYFLLRNDSAQALPYAEKAVAGAQESPSAQLVLGRSLVETTNINGGMEHLQSAVKLDPGNLEIHLALAEAYSRSGRKEDAWRERMLCLDLTKSEGITVAHP